MKQRLSVRAIITEGDKLLLLRRANGRPSILGNYELPGGKLAYGEQPEDSLRRYLHDDAGIHVQSAQLFDAVTYIDHDDSSVQYVVIVYTISVAQGHHPIRLSGNYDKYKWLSMSKDQQVPLTDLTQLLIGILRQDSVAQEIAATSHTDVGKTTVDGVVVYTDGGSRGNPGPSAAGFVIIDASEKVIDQGGEYLGITTNTQAEYQAVRLGLEQVIVHSYKKAVFRIDSMMVVNQLRGIYRVKNRELWPIHERIRELVAQLDAVSFQHVPREFNQLADGMVNKTLDERIRQKTTTTV